MRTATLRLEDMKTTIINMGYVGENEHKQIRFDGKKMFQEYPNASVSLTVCPPAGEAYPATIERDGDFVLWTITDSDLVAEGCGEIQLTFTESPHIAKSYICRTKVLRSLVPTGDIPSGLDDFITRADALLEELEDAIPEGGTTGQVLAKKSNDDFDTEWVDQTGGGGTGDYTDLTNKPQIGGVTLTGDKSLHDLGAASEEAVGAKYTKPSGGIPDTDLASGVQTSLGKADSAYQKPVSGIPASDMASGVIPVLTDLIDDTAGDGDTNKVWSADKSSELLNDLSVLEPLASASDVGKYPKVKTVSNGKVTEYEFGSGSGGSEHGIPAGGSSGQILSKASSSNYDAEWVTPSGSGSDDAVVKATGDNVLYDVYTDRTEAYEKNIPSDALPWKATIKSINGKSYLNNGSAVILAPSSIVSIDSEGTQVDSISISDIVSSAFDGKMCMVDGISDEINFVKQKAIKRCASKTISSLTVTRITSWTHPLFRITATGRMKEPAMGFMEGYTKTTIPQTSSDFPDDSYLFTENSLYVYVRDDTYSTAEAFVQAMGSKLLVYALGTPTSTDIVISDKIEVSPGGKIRVTNTGNIDVPSTITYFIPHNNINPKDVDGECLTLRRNLPTYYTSQPENPDDFSDDSYIDVKIESIPSGKHFIFFTDSHWDWNNNAKHSADLMQYVRRRTGINTVVFGGDYINSENTKYLARQVLGDFAYTYLATFGRDMLPVIGNHDINLANQVGQGTESAMYLPFSITQKVLFNSLPPTAHTQYEYDYAKIDELSIDADHKNELAAYLKLSYYYDDPVRKIRYIILNSGNPNYGHIYDIFGKDDCRIAMDWVYWVMCNTPENYDVVMCIHQLYAAWATGAAATGAGYSYAFPSLAMGLKTKTLKYIYLAEPANANLKAWYPKSKYYYDFTKCNNVGKVFFVVGHSHCDYIAVVNQDTSEPGQVNYTAYAGSTIDQTTVTTYNGCPIPVIYVGTDAYGRKNDCPEGHEMDMTVDTVTEHAFDVLSIQDSAIRTTRFGSGSDRVVYINS